MTVVFLIVAGGAFPMYHFMKRWIAGHEIFLAYKISLLAWFVGFPAAWHTISGLFLAQRVPQPHQLRQAPSSFCLVCGCSIPRHELAEGVVQFGEWPLIQARKLSAAGRCWSVPGCRLPS